MVESPYAYTLLLILWFLVAHGFRTVKLMFDAG